MFFFNPAVAGQTTQFDLEKKKEIKKNYFSFPAASHAPFVSDDFPAATWPMA